MLPETWEEQQQISSEPEEVPGDLNIACGDRVQVGADLEAVVFSLSVGSKMAQKNPRIQVAQNTNGAEIHCRCGFSPVHIRVQLKLLSQRSPTAPRGQNTQWLLFRDGKSWVHFPSQSPHIS